MEKQKKVLLLAASFMGLYEDIRGALIAMGFAVTWIEDCQIEGNPYNKRSINRKTKTVEEYNKDVDSFWSLQFERSQDFPLFDYYLAIDGLMVSPGFFDMLERYNPRIKKILYLYDRVDGNYELDVFFKNYDVIYTFEKSDSQKYSISHLPLYWLQDTNNTKENYDIFGMASYKAGERFEIYTKVRNIAIHFGLKVNIHLWYAPVKNRILYIIVYLIKKILHKKMLSLSELKDEIFTDRTMTPAVFRHNIFLSKVVLDTSNDFQDGLTARFMWAIGAGKRIITNNRSVCNYTFYTPEQILILDNNYDEIVDFINKPFEMREDIKKMLLPYRIDNWLKTMLA